jgi:hypothetical protein
MNILFIAREDAVEFLGLVTTRKNGYAVPALLTMPDGTVACFVYGGFGKLFLRCFKFLQAYNIGCGFVQPAKENREAAMDAVNIVGCDLHNIAGRK